MRTHIDRDRGTFSEKEIVDQELSVPADIQIRWYGSMRSMRSMRANE
jgi:hypothetical protein